VQEQIIIGIKYNYLTLC